MALVHTIGHGTKTTEELIEMLQGADVRRLVDVRRFPGSRRHPQFSRAALERTLGAAKLDYEWRGEELGGRRAASESSRHPAWRNRSFRAYADHMDTAGFRAALEALEEVAVYELPAVMCAETLWWHCHRRLIADALLLRGTRVVHLLSPGSAQEHVLNPAARASDGGWPVYDLGVTPELITPEIATAELPS
jgi:uncharacterized protein (DUF488 family)